jgi:hypothetical protein
MKSTFDLVLRFVEDAERKMRGKRENGKRRTDSQREELHMCVEDGFSIIPITTLHSFLSADENVLAISVGEGSLLISGH